MADRQQAWSERKARIVAEYAAHFCAALSPSTPVWLVDGQAGAAHYGSGRWQVPGAPIEVAEHAANLARKLGRPIRCLLVEPDPAQAAAIQAALASLGEQALVWPGEWAALQPAALKQLAGGAALLLLDSAALHPIAGGLEHLARRLAKTEVLVRYQRQAVADLLAARADEAALRPSEAALDRLFGARSWRTVVEGASDAAERDLQLRDLYVQRLIEVRGGRFKWAAACPVHTSWGALEYDLVFATPDRAAGAALNAVLYQAEGQRAEDPEAYLRQQTAGRARQTSLFDAAPPSAQALREARIAALVESLEIICATQPRLWSYADLFDQLLRGGWFGHLTTDHLQAACRALQKSGRLQRVSQGKAWDATTLIRLRRDKE
jgi:three-Cys-motif partner protein